MPIRKPAIPAVLNEPHIGLRAQPRKRRILGAIVNDDDFISSRPRIRPDALDAEPRICNRVVTEQNDADLMQSMPSFLLFPAHSCMHMR